MTDHLTDLDDAYANMPHIPDGADYPPRWTSAAEAYRAETPGARDVSYGPSPRQTIDFFEADDIAKGTMIFVHGGFWRAFDNKSWSHLAKGARAHGWSVAMPAYDLCPEVSIATITQQVAAAVTFVARNTKGPISLAGHSAGGHLVARMLAPGILHTEVSERIQHVMPISPLSDLTPLIRTSMNADFRLDTAMAEAESPLAQPRPDVPVSVWVGADERPAFLDQAMWLASHWNVPEIIVQDRHHFDIIDPLAEGTSDMVRHLTGGN